MLIEDIRPFTRICRYTNPCNYLTFLFPLRKARFAVTGLSLLRKYYPFTKITLVSLMVQTQSVVYILG